MGHLAILVLGTALALAAPAAQSSGGQNDNKKSAGKAKSEKSAAQSTLTGCVDEQDGLYVLLDEKSVRRIADLQAEGFPQEGFANYIGQKVTVRGRLAANEGRPVMRVQKVETISAQCTPAGQ